MRGKYFLLFLYMKAVLSLLLKAMKDPLIDKGFCWLSKQQLYVCRASFDVIFNISVNARLGEKCPGHEVALSDTCMFSKKFMSKRISGMNILQPFKNKPFSKVTGGHATHTSICVYV